MSSLDSAVAYTSISSEDVPFWGIRFFSIEQPDSPEAAPQSPIQTPPVPQDEDEREPMFIQPHAPDYVPEPMYPQDIPLDDEHVFLDEEQQLPPIDSPTSESPGYVTESDLEEDPEEYKDDESEDGSVDYPMDRGDDGDSDSSGDDTNDEDEDEEDEEEEEEYLALANATVVVPTASISLPPEAEVEILLAMPTSPPSPLTSLSPPSARERLARCTAPSAHSSPPPSLIDTVTAALPSPPLPPLPPPLYISSPVDRRDDIPETELPPRKKSCLFALGPNTLDAEAIRRGIREVEYGIRNTWVDPAKAVLEITLMTLGEVNTRIRELAELQEHDTQNLYALLEDAQDSRTRVSHRVAMDSQRVYAYESQLHAHQTQLQLQGTLIQTQHQAELLALREQLRRARQPRLDARVSDHQDASRNADSNI
nr:hypothetical protein [Tanacetum cinerariifolium]